MRDKNGDIIAAWIGGILGFVLGMFVLVYLPMASNYKECGSVFLCEGRK